MNNYTYLNEEWYRSLRNGLHNNGNYLNEMNNSVLVPPGEGYNRGNLFARLYDQYKNYSPVVLRGNSEQERLFLELASICFAAHELNLYLDLNPDDETMLRLFNDYRRKCDELTKEYEEKYGALSIRSATLDTSPFMWEKGPWPWEDRFYV